MNLFYAPDLTSNTYTLSEEESKHCIRVLRLTEGDSISLVDGKGGFYTAKISEANPKRCAATITETKKEFGKRNTYLHLAVAPTKNIERYEWFLEKATEIGIDEITPIICEHSERAIVKTDRLNKVIVSAMKQSLKAYLPQLNEAVKLEAFLKKSFNGQQFIAHCQKGNSPITHLKHGYTPKQNVLVLIGPEGDFSKQEIELALKNDFKEISLGQSRLRTETAALMACSIVNISNEFTPEFGL